MKKKLLDTKFTIKEVVATGIGAALFVVIGMISIPTPVPNTSIQLQYAVQALFSVVFGAFGWLRVGVIWHGNKKAIARDGLPDGLDWPSYQRCYGRLRSLVVMDYR